MAPATSSGRPARASAAAARPSAASVSASDWDIAATASWDIDLFGRLRSGALAARADAEAQAAALDGVQVAVVADTVQAYVEFCAATRATAEAKSVAAAQERSVRDASRRHVNIHKQRCIA